MQRCVCACLCLCLVSGCSDCVSSGGKREERERDRERQRQRQRKRESEEREGGREGGREGERERGILNPGSAGGAGDQGGCSPAAARCSAGQPAPPLSGSPSPIPHSRCPAAETSAVRLIPPFAGRYDSSNALAAHFRHVACVSLLAWMSISATAKTPENCCCNSSCMMPATNCHCWQLIVAMFYEMLVSLNVSFLTEFLVSFFGHLQTYFGFLLCIHARAP